MDAVRSSTSNVLLLTATITPPQGTPNLSRVDPQQRLEDYLHALAFYLDHVPATFGHVVFCENSDTDVSRLQELVRAKGATQKVTFFVKNGLDYPPHFDRGYGEFKLIDDAMEKVPDLRHPLSVIWKVTGRYIVRNIGPIVRRTAPKFDLACNYRNHPKRWVDTYLIAWTPTAYERYLRNSYEHLKANVPGHIPGTAAEEMLRTYLDARPQALISKRFPITPDVHGVRAADNRRYERSLSLKYQARRLARHVAPWLWI